MKKFFGLRAKISSYLKDNNGENKKAKGTKKSTIKIKIDLKGYRKCLKTSQIENKIN